MKKIILLMVCLFIVGGCAAATSNTIPAGKTDADWEADEAYCLKESGRMTGFFAQTPIGLAVNMGGADARNAACLKRLGWIAEK